MRLLLRALVVAMLGALAADVALVAVYAHAPRLVLSMDVDPPTVIRGLYPVEHDPSGLSFAWTSEDVSIDLPGLDRSHAWTLVFRVKAGRGPELPLPQLTISADGVILATRRIGNTMQEIAVPLPVVAGGRRGVRLALRVAPGFVPGPSDTRKLGLVLDEFRLDPAPSSIALVSDAALAAAAMAAVLFGAAVALCGLPVWAALLVTLLFACAAALPIATGTAPYTGAYLATLTPLAGVVGTVGVLIAALATRGGRQPIATAAGCAIAASMGLLLLELFGLLHPEKSVVDAVFHAHRLQWVISGRYFFTQPMPDGVQFPYAIALYVFAAPWSSLATDYVTLLRIIVSGAHAVAALLLYPLVVRLWGDRITGIAAVVFAHLAPLPFVVIGNANLTYAFGQSVATMAVALAVMWPLTLSRTWRSIGLIAALAGVVAVGLLSHVGLVPLLGGLLTSSALLFIWRGDPATRGAGWSIVIATIVAAVLAVAIYYAHFGDAFRSAVRVSAQAQAETPRPASDAAGAATAPGPSGVTPSATPADGAPNKAASPTQASAARPQPAGSSRLARLGRVMRLIVDAYGWPLIALAAIGGWFVAARGGRDRLTLLLAAAGLMYVVVVGASVLAPVQPRFERYADEFISRVHYAMLPAVVILAGLAVSRAAQAGAILRGVAAVLTLAAVVVGTYQWLAWIS
jgi:hypothetical protein